MGDVRPNHMVFRPPSKFDAFEFDPALVGRGWDDIELGYEYSDYPEKSVVVTDEMVDMFARLTGDYNPIHLDEQFARKTIHRRRIAHGALLLALCIGQYHGSGYTYGTTLALLGTRGRFLRACAVGDEVYVNFVVIDKETEAHPKRGRVTYRSWLRSVADHEPYIEVEFDVLIRRLRGKSARRRLGIETIHVNGNGRCVGET